MYFKLFCVLPLAFSFYHQKCYPSQNEGRISEAATALDTWLRHNPKYNADELHRIASDELDAQENGSADIDPFLSFFDRDSLLVRLAGLMALR